MSLGIGISQVTVMLPRSSSRDTISAFGRERSVLLERAREHVTEAAAGVNEFLAGPMAEFRKAVAAAELELVPELGPIEVGGGK